MQRLTFHPITLSRSHLLTFHPLNVLAQAANPRAPMQVVAWVVVLIVVVLVAFAVVWVLHKTLFSDKASGDDAEGLMETMRKMKARGEMSPEEFDQAKRALQRKSVADVEAKLAARQTASSPEAKRGAAQEAARRIMEGKDPPAPR